MSHIRKLVLPFAAVLALAACGAGSSDTVGPALETPSISGTEGVSSAATPTSNESGQSGGSQLPRPETPASNAPIDVDRAAAVPLEPESALAQLLSKFPEKSIISAKIGKAPSDGDWVGPWLYVQFPVTGSEPEDAVLARWEGELLVSDLADATAAGENIADAVEGIHIDYVLPDGEILSGESQPTGSAYKGQVFPMQMDDKDLSTSIVKTVASYGLGIDTIEIFHPQDTAVIVVATVSSAEAMKGQLQKLELDLLLAGADVPRFEGIYLEIDLTEGTPIAKIAAAPRAGAGFMWVKPGLEEALGSRPHG